MAGSSGVHRKESGDRPGSRIRVDRDAVIDAAIALADADGLDAVTMRRLGGLVGLEAMSLYTHVRGREDLVDAMVDAVVGRLPIRHGGDWRSSLRATLVAAHAVMRDHAWAGHALATRAAAGPNARRHIGEVTDAVVAGGCTAELAARAVRVLGARAFGIASGPFGEDLDEATFAFAIDLVIDGIEHERARQARADGTTRNGGDWRQW